MNKNGCYALTLVVSCLSLSGNIAAADTALMSTTQYEDYSVKYQCILNRYHDDLEKKEEALIKLDEEFGLDEDDFDAFDEMASEYERDQTLLDAVRSRVAKDCPP